MIRDLADRALSALFALWIDRHDRSVRRATIRNSRKEQNR